MPCTLCFPVCTPLLTFYLYNDTSLDLFFNPLAGAISNVESDNDDALDSQNDNKTPQVTGNEIAESVVVPNRPNSEYKGEFVLTPLLLICVLISASMV